MSACRSRRARLTIAARIASRSLIAVRSRAVSLRADSSASRLRCRSICSWILMASACSSRSAATCSGVLPDTSASATTRSRSFREAPASSISSSFAVTSMGRSCRTVGGQRASSRDPRRIRRMPSSAPRTLADQFRGWSDAQLSTLLEARPDLATPAPHDSSQLAARVVVKSSVLRVLDGLDALELTVLQALVQGTDPADLPANPDRLAGAIERLESLALVWGSPRRPVLVVGDLLRLPPGPPTDEVTDLLAVLGPAARAILDHLEETRADGRWSGGAGPTAELVAAGLLARLDERRVTLPWSVRLTLGTAPGRRLDEPPELATSERVQSVADRAAAGAAFELVRRTELLLDRWGTHPPPALKAGGLGVRELRAAAALCLLYTSDAADDLLCV